MFHVLHLVFFFFLLFQFPAPMAMAMAFSFKFPLPFFYYFLLSTEGESPSSFPYLPDGEKAVLALTFLAWSLFLLLLLEV